MMAQRERGRGRGEDGPETFIRGARRRQLVECAIEVIAEVGLARASTVRIAERAGVSRGVLTYHFRDRAELIDQVIARVYELGARALDPGLRDTATPREFLLAFIGGSVEFYAAYPRHVAALHAVFAGYEEGAPARGEDRRHTRELDQLCELLWEGQTRGEFRDFNVDVMARTVRQALDGALAHVAAGGPVQPYASELQALFDAATRSAAPRSGEPP
ncbi:TetR/AcrR family transcriptional regulator [Tomitella gaofuii]|uniref:TetR/AcrR family transcriptional regulator n=1 Tax=Tomitella gaofuii TaxID=2760083 RepID=UPI0015F8A07F|nr:TetR/AcrR family transcriptional regulator [Tomitella gaofuii]